METNTPIVSILLPTHNGARHIAGAVKSVQGQTHVLWELLIIDDGSTDATEKIVGGFLSDARIRYIKNETNLGIQKTLNKGLREANGEYIARIDDDDRWNDTRKLEMQLKFFAEHPDHLLVGTGLIVVDEQGTELSRYIPPQKDEDIRRRILGQTCFAHSSVMFKKAPVLAHGGYGESFAVRHVEDYDLWLYLGTTGKFANLGTYSISLMVHEASLTSRNRIVQARHALTTAFKYRAAYPHGYGGFIMAACRLVFFWLRSIIPLPKKYVYRLQAFIKQL